MVERQRLERAALNAAERERRIIGQTLHDTVSQSLTGIYFQAQVIVRNLERDSGSGVQAVTALAETIHGTVVELSNVTRSLQAVEGAAPGPDVRP